jgi:UDP-2,3-diacylglucosamine pyrophosphatase LpxH
MRTATARRNAVPADSGETSVVAKGPLHERVTTSKPWPGPAKPRPRDQVAKLKLVVSDFHLGTGRWHPDGELNVLEDFHRDGRFEEFLAHYTSGPYEDAEIELIFNGDMLNLIQADYRGHFPTILTEAISVEKLRKVIEGHPRFFDTLRRFLSESKHSLTFIVGNHDQEMLWPATRKLFEEAVGRAVQWKNFHYFVDGIHIEHGHQYEAVNRVDPVRPFLTEGLAEPILNLPWGTLFTASYIVRLKLHRPYVDKVRPFRMVLWWMLLHDTTISLQYLFRLIAYFIVTRFGRSRYRHSSLKTTLRMLLEASVFPDLSDAARRILRTPEVHTVIFGHTHIHKFQQFGPKKRYLNTGTWIDMVSLDLGSYGRRTQLTYVRVDYDEDGNALPQLRHWVGHQPIDEDAFGD